ncbi:MAG: c-type cytochrome biogenesis protein CcmI [Kiloniellaceae bacterium]|nr:c-type cytochrome biogenesis protein CcmI [Kiloniellaceae bacterium]
MTFWILAGVMAALLVVALLWPLLRARAAAPSAADYDRAVYRDQLRELEQDRLRGLIDDVEAEAARREIERRLLQTESGTAATASSGGSRWRRRMALALVVVLPPALGLGLYLELGTPGLPGLPLAGRDPGGPAELALLVDRLQQRTADRPEDIEAHLILAQLFERSGRFDDAALRYRTAIALIEGQGEVPAGLHAALGEALVAAAGGQVGREARLAFAAAIEADPGNSRARYFAGLAMAQDGRLQDAIDVWQGLAADSPADAPWLPVLRQQIARAAQELGIEPPPLAQPQAPLGQPPAEQSPGPSAAEVEAARNMTPQERMAFIRSMVDQLTTRLEAEPADPDGWLRLARAHAVLRENDRAEAALVRAEAEIAALPEGSPERTAFAQRLEELRRQLP